ALGQEISAGIGADAAVELSADGGTLLREVSTALRNRRHGCRVRLALAVAEAFVVDEEESLIFAKRPAEGRAELIRRQRLNATREVVGGIHRIVTEEFPGRVGKSVGPGARNN